LSGKANYIGLANSAICRCTSAALDAVTGHQSGLASLRCDRHSSGTQPRVAVYRDTVLVLYSTDTNPPASFEKYLIQFSPQHPTLWSCHTGHPLTLWNVLYPQSPARNRQLV
jgi:hypothetical protein